MTTLLTSPPTRPVAVAVARRGPVAAAASAVGLVAGLISIVGAGIPSFWGDEAASVLSAQRSLPSLLLELGHIDAVHGLYYALLHVWMDAAGASEFAVRLPSVIAAALAATGIVVLGRDLLGLRIGIIAGITLAVIPEFTRQAIEARSYALDIAVAIWLTVLVVRLIAHPSTSTMRRRAGWAAYAVGLGAAVTLFEFLAVIAVVHLLLVWALRADRPTRRRWAISTGVGAILSLPLVITAFAERGQIAFLSAYAYATPSNVLVHQWFGNIPFAVVAWALILTGLLAALVDRSRRRTVPAIAAWAFMLTAALLLVDLAIVPAYNLRYPSLSLGGVALLIALGIDALIIRIPRASLRTLTAAALIAVLSVAAWPTYLAQRGPYAKGGGSDLRQASEMLASLASPGDAVVFDQTVRTSEHPGVATRLYPQYFSRLDDVALTTPYWTRTSIWDARLPVDQLGSRLAGHDVVWADEIRGTESVDLDALQSLGYRIDAHYTVHRTVLYRLERTSP